MLQGIFGNATSTEPELEGLLEHAQRRDKPIVVSEAKGKPEMWHKITNHKKDAFYYVVGVAVLVALLAWPLINQDVTTVYMAAMALIGIPQTAESLTSSGCGVSSPWKFDSTYHSNRTLGDRSFYVHIPESYDSNVPHAVVLSFHGNEKNDAQQERISGFSRQGLTINSRVRTTFMRQIPGVEFAKGIIAVYPLGAWSPERPGKLPGHAWQGAPYAKVGTQVKRLAC
jgi:hypothetical protein